jgi:hypothetical protein
MTEESVKEESKTPEKESKKNTLTLIIDLDALDQPINIPVPLNQDVWHNQEDMSEDYQKQMSVLSVLMVYIAKTCNEGAETKDNSTKRMISIKTLLDILFLNLNINGYMAYGLLTELLHDIYMKTSGKQQTISLLKHIQRVNEKKAVEKSKSYVK